MKTKQTLLAVFLFLFSCTLFAQTKIIAHKSHSGKPGTFNIHSAHNFGEPGPRIMTDTVIHISDSIFVAIMHEDYFMYKDYKGNRWVDTVRYSETNKNYYLRHIYLGKSLKQLEQEMPHTVFLGFEEEQEQLTPRIHYFYPHHPNANPGHSPSTQPKQKSKKVNPVKNN